MITGDHAGKSGTVGSLGPRHVKPYQIKTADGDMIATADNEVEAPMS